MILGAEDEVRQDALQRRQAQKHRWYAIWGGFVYVRYGRVKDRYDKLEDKTQYIPSSYKLYMDNIDFRQKLVGEVVKLTIY